MPTDRINSLDTATMGRILQAAVGEFAHRPYGEASFNNVIRAAGISKGMMYYYFESKEDLFSAILHSAVRRLLGRIGPVAAVTDAKEYWCEVERILSIFLDFTADSSELSGLLHQIFQSPGQAEASPAKVAALALAHWLEGILALGCRLGAVRSDCSSSWLSVVAWVNWEAVQGRLAAGVVSVSEAREILLDLWRRTLED